jgi:23S rRNA (adenine2503-C2)-methyltransferase
MVPASSIDVAELELDELEAAMQTVGRPGFHARQLYRWVHRRGIIDFRRMTDLPCEARENLSHTWTVSTPRVAHREISSDGTTKFLLELADGRHIESVVIPESPGASAKGSGQPERLTFCLSTQVGCAMQCAFCLTGRMGIVRNLTAGEIAGQVRLLAGELKALDRRFNIVLMGMGEPLHNYDATMKALRMLAEPQGLAMSPRRMTLSTVGVLPALERLADEPLMPNLAVSLHATTEDQRDALVPVNRKYGLADLLDVCRRFPLARRHRITFEYVLLRGVNDRPEDARRLVKLLSDTKAKVNLLPFNEAAGLPFERPDDERVNRFAQHLAEHHVAVSVRKSRGRDIRAACGQLIVEGPRRSPGQRVAVLMG